MPDEPDGLPELLGVCPRNDAPEGTDVSLTHAPSPKTPLLSLEKANSDKILFVLEYVRSAVHLTRRYWTERHSCQGLCGNYFSQSTVGYIFFENVPACSVTSVARILGWITSGREIQPNHCIVSRRAFTVAPPDRGMAAKSDGSSLDAIVGCCWQQGIGANSCANMLPA